MEGGSDLHTPIKRKRKKQLIAFLTAISISCISSGSVIYAMSETSVTNNLSMGIVDIELEDRAQIPERVMPGQDLPGVKEIINEGNDCYVRAKINFRDAAVPMDNSLYGMPEGWAFHEDGYWYYSEILKTGDTVTLFAGFTIPEDYPEEGADKRFYLDVDVDAIQSQNFTPDFESASPWGNVVMERCLHEDGYDISTFKKADDQVFSVTYEGEARGLFAEPDDFFSDLPTLLPGDVFTDHAALQNHSNRDIILYFWNETKNTDLLDAVTMTGSLNGEVFYDGPLSGTFNEQMVIPAGQEVDLSFTIIVPASLQNAYTLLNDQVRWIFSTEPIMKAEHEGVRPPKTGVTDVIGLTLMALGLSAGCGAVVIKRRKEEQE